MAKVKVKTFGKSALGFVFIDTAATKGAQVGVDLIGPDGKVVSRDTWKHLLASGDQSNTGANGGTTDDLEEGAFNLYFTKVRAQDAVGEILADSDNVTLRYAGDPKRITADLKGLADSGTGSFKLITRDAKGRVSGTKPGAALNVPYDNANSGLSATNAQDAIDELAEQPSGAGVPYLVPDGTTYAVPERIQALWTVPIELEGSASLEVDGLLVEVA